MTIFAEERQDDRVEFLDTVPESLRQYRSVTLTAAVIRGGESVDEPVTFHTDGPDPGCYDAGVNDNSLTVKCLYPSRYPLRITAEGGGMEAVAEIVLAGF